MARRRALRTGVGRALLVLAGLVTGLVGAELVARHQVGTPNEWMLVNTPNWYDTSIFQPDRELFQVLRPGAVGRFRTPEFTTRVEIAAPGMRGPALAPPVPGELRVLTVGDSFTLGVQVEREASFQALLGTSLSASLASAPGRTVQVIDAGVDGYGTAQAARYARRLAPSLRPDLLLLIFFLGNDLSDNQGFRPGSYPEQAQALPSLLSPTDRLLGGFALYLHLRAWQRGRRLALDPAMSHHRAQVALFGAGADLSAALPDTVRALAELEALGQELGVPVVVALAPPAYALREVDTVAALRMVGVPGRPDPEGPARAVKAVIPASMQVVDLAPALRAAEAGGRSYYIFDGHWTERGHAAVAQALEPSLRAALASQATPR